MTVYELVDLCGDLLCVVIGTGIVGRFLLVLFE